MYVKRWIVFYVSSFIVMVMNPVMSKEYSSANTATNVIELYTSEGCSSCPPADRWLSKLKSAPELFKRIIPLAFHVDYWNQLGWIDRFSSKAYSHRQYRHQQEGNISQVYTPGFIANNKEWRGWYNGTSLLPDTQKNVGVLKVEHHEHSRQIRVSFYPESNIDGNRLLVNVAIIGMDLTNEIKSGENRGRKLVHDFVVLEHSQQLVRVSNDKMQQWQLAMPEIPASGQKQSGLVVWLSRPESIRIIQATGGYL